MLKGLLKKQKVISLTDEAWEHYQNYLDSCSIENPDGDTDELVELIELLQHVAPFQQTLVQVTSRDELLPILVSVAATTLADQSVTRFLSTRDTNAETAVTNDSAHYYFTLATRMVPNNAAAWSMAANFARMTKSVALHSVARAYQTAAEHAAQVRTDALQLFDTTSAVALDESVNEWIEALLLNQVVGVEYEEDDQWSASAVEATARYMAATLFSMVDEHDKAKEQLMHFQLTHRLHPNVWNGKTTSNKDLLRALTEPLPTQPALCQENVLPAALYEKLVHFFKPDAVYWQQSDYDQRGYYSYFMDYNDAARSTPTNVIEDAIVNHMLPLVKSRLTEQQASNICGFEWWVHTRPLQANLGHNLHFDTDEALLKDKGEITHPLVSSVLYLTGGKNGGATFVLNQSPETESVADGCWYNEPSDNTLFMFPGHMLHGVLPCPAENSVDTNAPPPTIEALCQGTTPKSAQQQQHRLTFMVGFWTRRVPDSILTEQKLYGPCGPLPHATDAHSWVKQIQEGYDGSTKHPVAPPMSVEIHPVPRVEPAWETISCRPNEPMLEIPRAIDHRFFVNRAPTCFRNSLFERDDESEGDCSSVETDD
jgi:hypothetical protein